MATVPARAATTVVGDLQAFLKGVDLKTKRYVTQLGEIYTDEVRRAMRASPASGRTYRRLRNSGFKRRAQGKALRASDYIVHRASAPGEAPAVDRATLVNSVTYEVQLTERGWSVVGGSSLAGIPTFLEYGTRTIAPRPVFRPALLAILPRAQQLAAQLGAA